MMAVKAHFFQMAEKILKGKLLAWLIERLDKIGSRLSESNNIWVKVSLFFLRMESLNITAIQLFIPHLLFINIPSRAPCNIQVCPFSSQILLPPFSLISVSLLLFYSFSSLSL